MQYFQLFSSASIERQERACVRCMVSPLTLMINKAAIRIDVYLIISIYKLHIQINRGKMDNEFDPQQQLLLTSQLVKLLENLGNNQGRRYSFHAELQIMLRTFECGHTFCQQCIFTYIHSFKGKKPEVKCPECHVPVDPPFSRSVMKDIFKQNLVDSLQPSYRETEKILIQRIGKLFPRYNLDFLLEQFTYPSTAISSRKKHQRSRMMAGLANIVKEKLEMSFEKFIQQIRDKEAFQRMIESVGNPQKMDIEHAIIQIRPQSDRDFNFIGINSKIKLPNPEASKIKKYLEKRLLLRLKQNADLAKEVVRSDCHQLNPQVTLYMMGRILEQGQSLVGATDPLFYTFKI